MGIFASKYRFKLNGSDWWVRVAVTSVGLSYKVKVDGDLLFAEKREQTSEEILTPQTFQINHDHQLYALEIGPVSALGYGVHVYKDNQLIYRYKDRDFVRLKRHEKVFGKFDKINALLEKWGEKDTRPFWKTFLEACLIGGLVGLIYASIRIFIAQIGGPDFGSLGIWPIAILCGSAALFLPAKLRFIR